MRDECDNRRCRRQGTVKLAPGFIASAVSDDGKIEAAMIGVQFRPIFYTAPSMHWPFFSLR